MSDNQPNISGVSITSHTQAPNTTKTTTVHTYPATPHPDTSLTETPSSTSKAASQRTLRRGK